VQNQTTLSDFTNYAYSGSCDKKAILELVKLRPIDRLQDYPGPADQQEVFSLPTSQASIRLWKTSDSRLAGYALSLKGQSFASLAFEYLSEFANGNLGDEMVSWGEQSFRNNYQGQATELVTNIRADDQHRMRLLKRHAFRLLPERILKLARLLAEPIPPPVLSPGFEIRPLAGDSQVAAWVAMHRAAFGTQNMTLEYRQAWMSVEDYDPQLDLVALAPDGSLAAYVFASIHPEENSLCGQKTGYTDPVGTHPLYRRRGLCRALLLTALQLLKNRGMEIAYLSTSSENIAVQRVAQSVGFRVVSGWDRYAKEFSKDEDEHFDVD